jgi:dTDP-4-dehydrorhamnose reductase
VIRVLVLGGSGMLGSMIVDVLSRESDFTVSATVRRPELCEYLRPRYPRSHWYVPDLTGETLPLRIFENQAWVVNAIGMTKPLIRDDHPAEVEQAVNINARLPHLIARAAAEVGAGVLQIATDCVFSGARGSYGEDDPHDALDVYGKTKSLGETFQPGTCHLRCSIIGPEYKEFRFLLEWFRRQPRDARLKGFVNHRWNGITTLHFARLCRGIMRGRPALGHLHHIVPAESATKAEMLHMFARVYRRTDIHVEDVQAATIVDRTLVTKNGDLNRALWSAAGYAEPPTVPEMIDELAAFDYRGA